MESGLEDRNNPFRSRHIGLRWPVSMESGLEDRNNAIVTERTTICLRSLNGVRPRRPEQLILTKGKK